MAKQNDAKRFKELATVESDYAVKLEGDVRGYGNEIFREIINSIAIDSKKHAGLFKACAAVCEGEGLSLHEDEYDELVASLKKHEVVEGNMIKTIDGLLEKQEDPRIVMMLNYIKEDELRHHKLLENMNAMVVKKEMILEKDIWDQLFRDVLTHGHAPPDEWEEPE